MTFFSAISRIMRTIHIIGYMHAFYAYPLQRFNLLIKRGLKNVITRKSICCCKPNTG